MNIFNFFTESKPKKKRGRPKKYFTDIIESFDPVLLYKVNLPYQEYINYEK